MSKKHPSAAEARWRAIYRYRRMRTTYLREVGIFIFLGVCAFGIWLFWNVS
jgi:hypothetical protein